MAEEAAQPIRRTRKQATEFVIDSLIQLGLRPNPTSRLMQMYRVMTDHTIPDDFVRPDHPKFQTAVESVRDITLLQFVFDNAGPLLQSDEFRRRLRTVLKDSELPQQDGEQTQGRDAQSELFVAALCQSSGLIPVTLAEPDVRCVVSGTEFGIAVKRIKNLARLVHRIREAATQIDGAKLPGIIALDTTIALNQGNGRIGDAISDQEFKETTRQGFLAFGRLFEPQIQEAIRGRGVRGLIFHDHQLRFRREQDWWLESMNFWIPTAGHNARRVREFNRFYNRYLSGLPHLEDLAK